MVEIIDIYKGDENRYRYGRFCFTQINISELGMYSSLGPDYESYYVFNRLIFIPLC